MSPLNSSAAPPTRDDVHRDLLLLPDAAGPVQSVVFGRLRTASSMREDDMPPDYLAALAREMADERQKLRDAIALLEEVLSQVVV